MAIVPYQLAGDRDKAAIMAETEGITEAVQMALAHSPFEHVRRTLARNATITEAVMAVLVQDKYHVARQEMAANRSLPGALMLRLAADTVWQVRNELAFRRDAPDQIQTILTRDSEENVRCTLASRTTNAEIQVILAHDDSIWVRTYLAQNNFVCVAAQVKLRVDSEANVRRTLKQNPAYNPAACDIFCEDRIRNFIEGHRPPTPGLSK